MDALDRTILAELIGRLGGLQDERLHMILVGSSGQYLCDEEVARGTLRFVSGLFRELVERALNRGAYGIVLVHNHPNGDPRPSAADVAFTRNLRWIGGPLEVEVIDHLIVAGASVFSMKRSGHL